MHSDTWTVRQLFQDRKQFVVPFYQRAYAWNPEDHWKPLWLDIQDKAAIRLQGNDLPNAHFLGATLFQRQDGPSIRGVPTFQIIDGQQRLTTLQFVLAAFLIAFGEKGISALDSTLTECLINTNPDTMRDPAIERYKVWPTFRDRSDYITTMGARSLQDLRGTYPAHFTKTGELRRIGIAHPPALEAIWTFAGWGIAYLSRSDAAPAAAAEALTQAVLLDLKLVLIHLDAGDDAQVIFESINARGEPLTAIDLIRNYIFLRADREGADAKALYDTCWQRFEDPAWSQPETRGRITRPRMEWLVHSLLQAETGNDVDLQRLYNDYRAYASNNTSTIPANEQLQRLALYAEHYLALTRGNSTLPIAAFGARIRSYDITHHLAFGRQRRRQGSHVSRPGVIRRPSRGLRA